MFKKTMTFDDLEENEVTKTFYFRYNKLEISRMLAFDQLEEKLEELMRPAADKGLTEPENARQAYETFEMLVAGAYGEKSDDGMVFDKTPEMTRRWMNHVAFTELIYELMGDVNLATEFLEKCLPQKELAKAKAELARTEAAEASEPKIETGGEMTTETPGEVTPSETLTDGKTDAEILAVKNPLELTPAQLQRGYMLKSSS